MAFGGDAREFGDDQYTPTMISQFDTQPMPALWDTTRGDIFTMANNPCFACDGPGIRGPSVQRQFGPPFRPQCAVNGRTVADVRARYPVANDPGQHGGRGGPYAPPSDADAAVIPRTGPIDVVQTTGINSAERYSTFGADPTVAGANMCGRRPGCSCMGQIGCRQAAPGTQMGIDMFSAGGAAAMFPPNSLVFLMLLILIVYVCQLQTRVQLAEARVADMTPGMTPGMTPTRST